MATKKRKVKRAVSKKSGKKTGTKKTGVKKSVAKKVTPLRRKKRVGKIASARKNLLQRLDQVNQVVNRFEGEVEVLVKKLVKQGERSRKELRKNFEEILGKIRADKVLARASETRGELEKEVRRLAEEAIEGLKEVEALIPAKKISGLFENARTRLGNIVELLSENGFVLQARKTALNTRAEFLGLLSIPTQKDVEKLERKIVTLEKRLSNLARKAA